LSRTRVYGGLTIEEVAHVVGVGPTTVKADWQIARAWLKRELGESVS
jgi:DNA-directed RNA polymerase specialized sigma24 family protein